MKGYYEKYKMVEFGEECITFTTRNSLFMVVLLPFLVLNIFSMLIAYRFWLAESYVALVLIASIYLALSYTIYSLIGSHRHSKAIVDLRSNRLVVRDIFSNKRVIAIDNATLLSFEVETHHLGVGSKHRGVQYHLLATFGGEKIDLIQHRRGSELFSFIEYILRRCISDGDTLREACNSIDELGLYREFHYLFKKDAKEKTKKFLHLMLLWILMLPALLFGLLMLLAVIVALAS